VLYPTLRQAPRGKERTQLQGAIGAVGRVRRRRRVLSRTSRPSKKLLRGPTFSSGTPPGREFGRCVLCMAEVYAFLTVNEFVPAVHQPPPQWEVPY